eukprot:464199-Amphidinium_carterae.1
MGGDIVAGLTDYRAPSARHGGITNLSTADAGHVNGEYLVNSHYVVQMAGTTLIQLRYVVHIAGYSYFLCHSEHDASAHVLYRAARWHSFISCVSLTVRGSGQDVSEFSSRGALHVVTLAFPPYSLCVVSCPPLCP